MASICARVAVFAVLFASEGHVVVSEGVVFEAAAPTQSSLSRRAIGESVLAPPAALTQTLQSKSADVDHPAFFHWRGRMACVVNASSSNGRSNMLHLECVEGEGGLVELVGKENGRVSRWVQEAKSVLDEDDESLSGTHELLRGNVAWVRSKHFPALFLWTDWQDCEIDDAGSNHNIRKPLHLKCVEGGGGLVELHEKEPENGRVSRWVQVPRAHLQKGQDYLFGSHELIRGNLDVVWVGQPVGPLERGIAPKRTSRGRLVTASSRHGRQRKV
uniref:Uncharacterized protein n=1 Tax=Zooxanthella nutricula TaxID=1333877 RepID=A0A7S2KD11_9DINO